VKRLVDRGFDFEVTLARGQAVLVVECKRELRPSAFYALAQRERLFSTRAPVVPVLAMPFISSRLSDLCIQHGWSWFDLAGNCHINVPNAIYLERLGHEPIRGQSRPKANLSTPEAARVIRALLAENVGSRWTQRYLAFHIGESKIPEPSLGLVNKVVQHLRDEAFIEVLPDGGFRLLDPIKLLFAWRDAYRFDRHERRGYFTLLQGKQLRDALARLHLDAGGFAAYAAFSAAELQAPHVRQPKTWIYVSGKYIKRFEERLQAKQVESGDNVMVLIPDDPGVFYLGDAGRVGDQQMASTNPVQTYIDLFNCGGRGQEAAEALLEQRLKPVWKSHKLYERLSQMSERVRLPSDRGGATSTG
jgi:hypothetical protein